MKNLTIAEVSGSHLGSILANDKQPPPSIASEGEEAECKIRENETLEELLR